jgi:prolyl-tRNA synthetase
MRWSRFYLHTTREVPSDAEVISHQLMVRSGMMRKVAAGIYTYLPMGWRSILKLQAIVRREMGEAGSTELAMPAVQPAELWEESGRWAKYGKELLRLEDRHDRAFCIGPTHEEVITDIVRRDVRSYRQLPVNLYQIQTKFRDEIRPRFGLMRGREFIMKDAYTFHTGEESLDEAYQEMHRAYCRIFEACELDYTVVDADSGAIGGSSSHEFMVLASTGESAVVSCPNSDYGANVEKATTKLPEGPSEAETRDLEEVSTPGATSVEDVAEMLGVTADRVVKTLLYEADGELVAVMVRGDRELNEVKLGNLLGAQELALAGEEAVTKATGAPVGFAGPVGLSDDVRLIGDESVRPLTNFVCGANKADAHFVGVNWERDAQPGEWADVLLVGGGDPCPVDGAPLDQSRGIEVGHIFKLGDVYSRSMGCNYLDDQGESHPMIMGCYGLGIGRTVAAAIEQNHDEDGICWPRPLAPFEVLLIALNPADEAVAEASEALYTQLREQGADVLFDDRNERPGVKFKDADLIGIPVRIVVGARSLAEGTVELSQRSDPRNRIQAPVGDAVGKALELLGS